MCPVLISLLLLFSINTNAQLQRYIGWYKGDHAFFIELDTTGKIKEGMLYGKFEEKGRMMYFRCPVKNVRIEDKEIHFHPDSRDIRYGRNADLSGGKRDRGNYFYASIYSIHGGRVRDGELWMRMSFVFACSAFDWVHFTPVKARKE